VHSFADVSTFRPLKIVADTANGMGGLVVPLVFEGLALRRRHHVRRTRRHVPNHPADPLNPANLVDLQARILETGADVGWPSMAMPTAFF